MSEKKIQLSMTDKIAFTIDGETFRTPLLANGEGAPTVDANDVFNMLIAAAHALQAERSTIKSMAVAFASAVLMDGTSVEVLDQEIEETK